MSGFFQAVWPITDDTLTLDTLTASALADLPAVAARHGSLINSNQTQWTVVDADTIPGAPDSPTGLILRAVMPAVASRLAAPVLEAMNWPGRPPLQAIEETHGLKRNTLASRVSSAELKPAEAQVCMSLTHTALWVMDDGVLRPLGKAS